MEKAKAYERLKKYAIENYNRTIELDDATLRAIANRKMLRKTCNKALALKYFNQTVHEDPL
jgi:hypothetical protein